MPWFASRNSETHEDLEDLQYLQSTRVYFCMASFAWHWIPPGWGFGSVHAFRSSSESAERKRSKVWQVSRVGEFFMRCFQRDREKTRYAKMFKTHQMQLSRPSWKNIPSFCTEIFIPLVRCNILTWTFLGPYSAASNHARCDFESCIVSALARLVGWPLGGFLW